MGNSDRKAHSQLNLKDRSVARAFICLLDDIARRGLDVFVSIMGLVVLAPILIFIGIRLKLSSPGPIIYRGLRVGRNGKYFHILKFRTMHEQEESYKGPKVTAQDDTRVTDFGRWLRDTKLNELPQLINVLKGEMSLVGPRPEDPSIVTKWPEEDRREILSVRPGVSSPASVIFRNEETLLRSKNVMFKYLREIMPTKVRLDLLYVRNRSILTDIDVIFWTMLVLFPRLGNLTIPESQLIWGPLTRFVDRYFSWFIIDILVSLFAVATAGIIWRLSAPLDVGLSRSVLFAFIIAFLFSAINAIIGISRISWSRARYTDAMDLAISSGITTALLFVINIIWPNGPLFPPTMLVVAGTLAFFGFVAIRYRTRIFTGLASRWIHLRHSNIAYYGERAIVIGSDESAQFAISLLRDSPLVQAISVLGLIDDEPRKIGLMINSCEIIGGINDIPDLVSKHDIGLIVLASTSSSQLEENNIISICQSTSAHTVLMPDIVDTLRAQFLTTEQDNGELLEKLFRNTTLDRLIDINNRQQFLRLAERELSRCRRYKCSMSLILIAVGHSGSKELSKNSEINIQVLRGVAERIRANLRDVDILGRYDQNLITILLPETDLPSAHIVMNRLRKCIPNSPFEVDQNYHTAIIDMAVEAIESYDLKIETIIDQMQDYLVATKSI